MKPGTKHVTQNVKRPAGAVPPVSAKPQTGKPTHWNEVAGWYDEHVGNDGNEYQQQVIFPGVLKLLGLLEKGAEVRPRILDLACGQGAFCRKLATLECGVTGVDAAAALVAAAEKRDATDKLGIRYLVADATRLAVGGQELPAESFDAVTIILAIQNMSPLSPLWKACHALLKPGGSLVLVMMHPCFRVPQRSDWQWDAAKGRQSRLVTQYLTSEKIAIQTHPGLAAHGKSESSTAHFHRPLQAYVNTLGSSGLLVDRMEEWPSHKKSQPGPKQAEMDRSRVEIPMFLAVRAKRV